MKADNIKPLTIKELLSNDRYLIPIYQRNYDWGERESLQLLEDFADYVSIDTHKKYYVGSVVVFVRNTGGEVYFETIDGQQRMTTLTILMNVLKTYKSIEAEMAWFQGPNLSYDHREDAEEALRMLEIGELSVKPVAGSIIDVYKTMMKNLDRILREKKINVAQFVKYILENVIIMRVPVPRDTDLNHYFEIMNSRGEQLEKHEVLKAILMNELEDDKNVRCLFNDLWEACSNMSSYVQMNMKTRMRSCIFSENWDHLQIGVEDFDSLVEKYEDFDEDNEDGDEYVCRTLSQLFVDADNNVRYDLPTDADTENDNSDRFGSIINFQNFLLQVLKVMYQSDVEYNVEINELIKLDDKRLIDIFGNVIRNCKDKRTFVKRYIMSLLSIRYIFDNYVIKRERYNNKEGWSLKRLKKYEKSKTNYVGTFSGKDDEDDTSKDIRMLQAMFHVSAPTQIYKHWLNAILFLLFKDSLEPSQIRNSLFKLACTYMLDRYLCDESVDFEDIIYKNRFSATNKQINWSRIDDGCGVENFIFNFYDYLIWKENTKKYPKFEFSYRTSVEHFYPQHPMEGCEKIQKEELDKFGNLCLISRGMNSKFSNNMPKAKQENFGRNDIVSELSLKLNEMMDIVKKGLWGKHEIDEYEKLCIERIKNALS